MQNVTKGHRERMGRLLLMHANHREEMESTSAGNICAAVGLKNTFTGDTICEATKQVILEPPRFPDPVVSVAIEPMTRADQDKLDDAMRKISDEDPTFVVRSNTETGQTIISGMGELHLEVLVDACAVSLTWRPTLELQKYPTGKPSQNRCGWRVGSSAKPVAMGSSDMSGWKWNRWNRALE